MPFNQLRRLIAVPALYLAVLHNAMGQIDQDAWKLCTHSDPAVAEAKIGACTRLLLQGNGTAEQLSTVYLSRGVGHAWLGQDNEALADYDAALRLNANSALALSNRGTLLWSEHQEARAKADLSAALAVPVTNADSALAHGVAEIYFASQGESQRYHHAVEALDQAVVGQFQPPAGK
jgi:tetratricopeptide (TPR) repeat protein